MELVVDANVIIAGFLKSATTRSLLLDDRLILSAPEHTLTESEKVLRSARLRKKLKGLSQAEVTSLLDQLTARIRMVPAISYRHHLKEAHQLAPHPEDAPYLALALHLGVPLWSNDADLARQPDVVVHPTMKLLELLAR